MSLEAALAAGTIVSFSLDLQTPAFTAIPGIISIGATGLTSESKEKTTLADTLKKYGAGMQDAPDKVVKGQFFASNTDQKAFITACKAKTEMLIQVAYPDTPTPGTGTGTIAQYVLKPLGFEVDEVAGEEWMMFTVPGKQNSDVTWTDPV